MSASSRKFYIAALIILLVLSAYPLVMGTRIVFIHLANGSVKTQDYARYVIPYMAVCLAIIISVLLYPVISKMKRGANILAIAVGLCLFIAVELYMESITITGSIMQKIVPKGPGIQSTVDWQLFSCIGTPAAVQAFQKPYSDAYKIHYFLVSFIIIALITNIVYGYGKLISEGGKTGKIVLWMQMIPTLLLLGLCIFANFTGFFRGTSEYLSPLSALLTSAFFIVLGVASGVYVGSYIINKSEYLSIFITFATSVIICSIMYYGEFKLLGGTLYRFGKSGVFTGLQVITVSPMDIMIIFVSGITAGVIMRFARKKYLDVLNKSLE